MLVRAQEEIPLSMRCHMVLVEGGRSVRPMALISCEAMTAKRRSPRKPGSVPTCHRVRLRATTASTTTNKVSTRRRRRRHGRLRTRSTVMTEINSSGATLDQGLGLRRSSGWLDCRTPREEDHAAQTYIDVLCATHRQTSLSMTAALTTRRTPTSADSCHSLVTYALNWSCETLPNGSATEDLMSLSFTRHLALCGRPGFVHTLESD